jgi:tetratricopeptide (TPR) repeat protein
MDNARLANGYASKAYAQAELKRYPEAAKDIEHALRLIGGKAPASINDWFAPLVERVRANAASTTPRAFSSIKIDIDDPDECLKRAKAAYDRKEWQLAIAYASKALALRPNTPDAMLYRGWALGMTPRARAEHLAALDDFSGYLRFEPANEWVYLHRAVSFRVVGAYAESLADGDEVARLNPSSKDAWSSRGVTLYEWRQFEAAIVDLSKALTIDPKDTFVLRHRGLAYVLSKKGPEAYADFQRAIELDPKDGDSYFGRGAAAVLMKQFDQAVADFKRAQQLLPANHPDQQHLARALKELQRDDTGEIVAAALVVGGLIALFAGGDGEAAEPATRYTTIADCPDCHGTYYLKCRACGRGPRDSWVWRPENERSCLTCRYGLRVCYHDRYKPVK